MPMTTGNTSWAKDDDGKCVECGEDRKPQQDEPDREREKMCKACYAEAVRKRNG